jgi:hypothetical protein
MFEPTAHPNPSQLQETLQLQKREAEVAEALAASPTYPAIAERTATAHRQKAGNHMEELPTCLTAGLPKEPPIVRTQNRIHLQNRIQNQAKVLRHWIQRPCSAR